MFTIKGQKLFRRLDSAYLRETYNLVRAHHSPHLFCVCDFGQQVMTTFYTSMISAPTSTHCPLHCPHLDSPGLLPVPPNYPSHHLPPCHFDHTDGREKLLHLNYNLKCTLSSCHSVSQSVLYPSLGQTEFESLLLQINAVISNCTKTFIKHK